MYGFDSLHPLHRLALGLHEVHVDLLFPLGVQLAAAFAIERVADCCDLRSFSTDSRATTG